MMVSYMAGLLSTPGEADHCNFLEMCKAVQGWGCRATGH